MINIGRLRIFYRGFNCSQRAYFWKQWGVTALGISVLGIMIFKK